MEFCPNWSFLTHSFTSNTTASNLIVIKNGTKGLVPMDPRNQTQCKSMLYLRQLSGSG